MRQKKNKARLNRIIDLAKKDTVIEKLKGRLQSRATINPRTFLAPKGHLTSSAFQSHDKASSLRANQNVKNSQDAIIRMLTGIPEFKNGDVSIEDKEIGHGRFGSVRPAYLKKLKLHVAAKIIDLSGSSEKAVVAEVIVSMTLSGHSNFPFCFGLMNKNVILMEYFSILLQGQVVACPSLAGILRKGITADKLKEVLMGVLEAFSFMHLRKILHNDIKADNIVVADTAKVIDFGKATMTTNPRIYNIVPGSKDHRVYNSCHRHLAYELRNIPGTKQSIDTDIYSIGYLFKHSAATIQCGKIVALGRMMKDQDPSRRISTDNALDKLKLL